MEDLKILEEKLAKSRNATERASLIDAIDKLKKEQKDVVLEKNMIPNRSASPRVDHKDTQRTRANLIMSEDRVIF